MPARPLLRTLSLLTIGCAALLATPAHAIQIATTTTLTASPATGVAGSPLKFTVTVMAGSTPVPSGQVAICNDVDFGCNLAEAFVVLQLSSNGTASVNLIGVGSDTLVQAGFAGTKTYAPSTSPEGVSFPFVNLNVPTPRPSPLPAPLATTRSRQHWRSTHWQTASLSNRALR